VLFCGIERTPKKAPGSQVRFRYVGGLELEKSAALASLKRILGAREHHTKKGGACIGPYGKERRRCPFRNAACPEQKGEISNWKKKRKRWLGQPEESESYLVKTKGRRGKLEEKGNGKHPERDTEWPQSVRDGESGGKDCWDTPPPGVL